MPSQSLGSVQSLVEPLSIVHPAMTNATMHAVIAILSKLCMDRKLKLVIKQRSLQCKVLIYGNTLSCVVKDGATATRLHFLALEQCRGSSAAPI